MFRVANCDEITLDNVKVTGYKGNSLIRAWSEGTRVNVNNLDCDVKDGELLTLADEEFVCRAI